MNKLNLILNNDFLDDIDDIDCYSLINESYRKNLDFKDFIKMWSKGKITDIYFIRDNYFTKYENNIYSERETEYINQCLCNNKYMYKYTDDYIKYINEGAEIHPEYHENEYICNMCNNNINSDFHYTEIGNENDLCDKCYNLLSINEKQLFELLLHNQYTCDMCLLTIKDTHFYKKYNNSDICNSCYSSFPLKEQKLYRLYINEQKPYENKDYKRIYNNEYERKGIELKYDCSILFQIHYEYEEYKYVMNYYNTCCSSNNMLSYHITKQRCINMLEKIVQFTSNYCENIYPSYEDIKKACLESY